MCRNRKECQANIEAENLAIEIDISNEGTTLRDRYGNELTAPNPANNLFKLFDYKNLPKFPDDKIDKWRDDDDEFDL
jgi:hypothetical protein